MYLYNGFTVKQVENGYEVTMEGRKAPMLCPKAEDIPRAMMLLQKYGWHSFGDLCMSTAEEICAVADACMALATKRREDVALIDELGNVVASLGELRERLLDRIAKHLNDVYEKEYYSNIDDDDL